MVNKSITFMVLAKLCLSLRSALKHVAADLFIRAKKKINNIFRQEDR